MDVLLKDRFFNPEFFAEFAGGIKKIHPELDQKGFYNALIDDLDSLELMDRVRRTSTLCRQFLPDDYRKSVEILKQIAPSLGSFTGIIISEFIGEFGLEDYDFSIQALGFVTRFASAEFAIRKFIRADFDHAMTYIEKWSKDENHHVRRLASEGTRPRLPWSFQLKMLMEDPTPVKKILARLKADPSLYVRKSVANHLNDISKEHPELMIDWVENWDQSVPETAFIVKRAARSLIKAGHPRSFALFGFEAEPQFTISVIGLSVDKVPFEGEVIFDFRIESESKKDQKLAIDFVMHFMKKNGKTAPKVFKLKEVVLPAGGTLTFSKKRDFIERSTRKHYAGRHRIDIVINGTVSAGVDFDLLPK